MAHKLALFVLLVSTALGQISNVASQGTGITVGVSDSQGGLPGSQGGISGSQGGLPGTQVGELPGATTCGIVYRTSFSNVTEFTLNLTKAIDISATEVTLFNLLADLAPCPKWELLFNTAAAQSRNQLNALSNLYSCLVGNTYTPKPQNFTFSTLEQGLEIAFFFDWNAVDLHLNLFSGTSIPSIQRVVHAAMVMKQQHQKLLSWIFTSLNRPNMNCANPQNVLAYRPAQELAISSTFNINTGGTESMAGTQGGSQGGVSGSQGGSQGGMSGTEGGSQGGSQGGVSGSQGAVSGSQVGTPTA
jgi:hypothetical protein